VVRTLLAVAVLASGLAWAGAPKELSLAKAEPKLKPETDLAAWLKQPFGVLHTELSPAVVVHSEAKGIGFFRNLSQWGLGAPSYLAVPTKDGVRIVRKGALVPKPMSEAWLLAWFNGSEGWTQWDAPVLLVLQHQPDSMTLDADGLTLQFPKEAGLIAVMPLYGIAKLPLTADSDFLKQHGLPSRGIHTDVWADGLPKAIEVRCRDFSQVLRRFPVHCTERFALDGDDLVITWDYQWLWIEDDWRMPARAAIPLPPTLALAWWAGKNVAEHPFPMEISGGMGFAGKIRDLDVFTPYGPYVSVEQGQAAAREPGSGGVPMPDPVVRMSVLKYVREALKTPTLDETNPAVAAIHKRLVDTLSNKFREQPPPRRPAPGAEGLDEKKAPPPKPLYDQVWDHGGPGNYCWQVMADRWYARAIPFLPPPVQERARAVLTNYLSEFILQESHYRPFRNMLLLAGPGIGMWGGYDDAGKFSANLLETIWNLVFYAGGQDTVRERWAMVRRFFITPLECDWKMFGRAAIAEMGDEGGPAVAMARLAYQAGDMDTYAFACYVFARELIHHYVKQVGAPYFRRNQPWHSAEPMPEEVYLTNYWGDLAGWQIDGPEYPKKTGERQSNNRWVRFSSEEVGRFYQEVLPKEVRAEMDLLTERAKANPKATYQIARDTAHIAPSLIRVRALVLAEPPYELAKLAPPDKWGGNAADTAAICTAALRASRPIQWEAIIPPAKTEFVLGLERAIERTGHATLALVCENAAFSPKAPPTATRYPFLRWWGWRAPKALPGLRDAGAFWSFGHIVPDGPAPKKAESRWLNWNTCAVSYGE